MRLARAVLLPSDVTVARICLLPRTLSIAFTTASFKFPICVALVHVTHVKRATPYFPKLLCVQYNTVHRVARATVQQQRHTYREPNPPLSSIIHTIFNHPHYLQSSTPFLSRSAAPTRAHTHTHARTRARASPCHGLNMVLMPSDCIHAHDANLTQAMTPAFPPSPLPSS